MADESDTAMSGVLPVPEHTMPSPANEPAAKRIKMNDSVDTEPANSSDEKGVEPGIESTKAGDATAEASAPSTDARDNRRNGLAPIKKEYLVDLSTLKTRVIDDDATEGRTADTHDEPLQDDRDRDSRDKGKVKKQRVKNKGQNTERTFGRFEDALPLCNSRAFYAEFSPRECKFGDRCRLCHDLRKYLEEGRRGDLEVYGGKCPVFDQYGYCPSGWKCRFVQSHMREIEHEDGRKELILIKDPSKTSKVNHADGEGAEKTDEDSKKADDHDEHRHGVYNAVSMNTKIELNRKRTDFAQADQYIKWLNAEAAATNEFHHRRKDEPTEDVADLRAQFVDPPFKPSEKRRLYFGPETPALAPLTTQGNLPFRRLCVELGAEITYSEMAMGTPLIQGSKSDWTLLKAHESEVSPPKFTPGKSFVFDNYDNSRDLKFGAQVSGNHPWVLTKAANALSRFCPHLRVIDLNCGCPIDMVFKSGAGSALLETHGKLERMIRGMNAVSGEIPISAKIRMGVKNNRPTATQVIGRLAFGARETRSRLGAPGCAAITLHGRSREQRYTKKADWGYIGECAALVQTYNEQKDRLTDTVDEPDESTLPNAKDGRMYFLGNGDCYSHIDYNDHIENAGVDSVMIGRGALIKPWIFEEVTTGQYLDKSSSERLQYIEKFVRYGLDAWGSDELGIGFTRRFLLEWLSFSSRYVPIGLLEYLPPNLNDRPPAFRGRDDMETLMASDNYLDWIKISEMFLGPAHPGFRFQPKHKSNSYEAEG